MEEDSDADLSFLLLLLLSLSSSFSSSSSSSSSSERRPKTWPENVKHVQIIVFHLQASLDRSIHV